VNKNDLIDYIANNNTSGLSKAQITEVIDLGLKGISGALQNGEETRLVGFGSFKVSKRAASTGRNPRTGETIQIEATNRVKFTPGKELKEAVNG
jgi:DNA-binding protein HU-beta